MELNRRYDCFDELKVTEKKLRFSEGLTEYFPPNPQLVKMVAWTISIPNEIIISLVFYQV